MFLKIILKMLEIIRNSCYNTDIDTKHKGLFLCKAS